MDPHRSIWVDVGPARSRDTTQIDLFSDQNEIRSTGTIVDYDRRAMTSASDLHRLVSAGVVAVWLGATGCTEDIEGSRNRAWIPPQGSEAEPGSNPAPTPSSSTPDTLDAGGNTDTPTDAGSKPDDVVPEGSFKAGTRLLAFTVANIRAGEGTDKDIVGSVPAGTRVTVKETSGASGWVKIEYDGTVGYTSKKLLSLATYSADRGQKMAARALALWDGKPSRDLCLAGVDDTAESAGAMPAGVNWIPRQPSAVDWQNYVNANPDELLKRGYVRENLDVNSIPKGAIIGWRAGQCGYHAQYGHIEVVADDKSSKACSDYCGSIKKTCGAPYVYIPIEL